MDVANAIGSVREIGKKVRLLGVVLIVLGAVCIWAPQVTGKTLAVIIGVLMILGGIGRTMFAWVAPSWGSTMLRGAVGVLTIIAGGYMIMQPDVGSRALAIVLMVYLFADGITSLIVALKMPPVAGGSWLMLGAIASIAVGVLMWMQWPASGELAIGLLIGIKLMLDGVSLFGTGQAAASATT